MWQYAMGWREIFTRILGDFTVEENVTPAWLRNPNTKRLLKLDLFYPDVGVAVRLQGLQGQRKVRKSVQNGIAHIQSSFNNTMVAITDVSGNMVSGASSGVGGF